jgi:retinol dehydrogenase 12
MNPPMELLTAQNYDLQFGTNVLGHYLLSKLLIPIMEATAATLPHTEPVRLIELTSDGHLINSFTGKGIINYDTLRSGQVRDAKRTSQLYFQSKSGNLLVARARARLLAGKNITTIAVHPGMQYISYNVLQLLTKLEGHIHSELTRYSNKVEAMIVNIPFTV